MGRTVCLYFENICNYIDNDPYAEEWWDYCHKYCCQISKENNLNCDTCKDYVSGMHIASECINYNMCWGACYYSDKGMCDDSWASNCIGYKEE